MIQNTNINLIKAAFTSAHYPGLLTGKSTHDFARNFICDIINFTQDADHIALLVASGLPRGYMGNTLDEVPGMVRWADEKRSSKADEKKKIDLIDVMERKGMTLFHDQHGVGFMSVKAGDTGTLNYEISSSAAERYFAKISYDLCKAPIPEKTMKELIGILEMRATFEGKKHTTHNSVS